MVYKITYKILSDIEINKEIEECIEYDTNNSYFIKTYGYTEKQNHNVITYYIDFDFVITFVNIGLALGTYNDIKKVAIELLRNKKLEDLIK